MGDFGLTLAGMEIVFQVEIEDFARKVLELRWPDVPNVLPAPPPLKPNMPHRLNLILRPFRFRLLRIQPVVRERRHPRRWTSVMKLRLIRMRLANVFPGVASKKVDVARRAPVKLGVREPLARDWAPALVARLRMVRPLWANAGSDVKRVFVLDDVNVVGHGSILTQGVVA